jgi:hypothetical protein
MTHLSIEQLKMRCRVSLWPDVTWSGASDILECFVCCYFQVFCKHSTKPCYIRLAEETRRKDVQGGNHGCCSDITAQAHQMYHQTDHLYKSTLLPTVYEIKKLYSNMLPIKLFVYLFICGLFNDTISSSDHSPFRLLHWTYGKNRLYIVDFLIVTPSSLVGGCFLVFGGTYFLHLQNRIGTSFEIQEMSKTNHSLLHFPVGPITPWRWRQYIPWKCW